MAGFELSIKVEDDSSADSSVMYREWLTRQEIKIGGKEVLRMR